MSLRQKLGASLYDALMKRPEEQGLRQWRTDLLQQATGHTLEIGPGTGANLPHYPPAVQQLTLVEPNPAMADIIDVDTYTGSGPIEFIDTFASDIPLPDNAVDTVVSTLVLCSVKDLAAALQELRRILNPRGQLLFLEHVASTDERTRAWQDRIDPIWHWCNGDCHMNRRTLEALKEQGFSIDSLTRAPMPAAPSLLNPTIRGRATPH